MGSQVCTTMLSDVSIFADRAALLLDNSGENRFHDFNVPISSKNLYKTVVLVYAGFPFTFIQMNSEYGNIIAPPIMLPPQRALLTQQQYRRKSKTTKQIIASSQQIY
ncbi:hypothetical protein QTP88_028281 [Uroleucon formosanum]